MWSHILCHPDSAYKRNDTIEKLCYAVHYSIGIKKCFRTIMPENLLRRCIAATGLCRVVFIRRHFKYSMKTLSDWNCYFKFAECELQSRLYGAEKLCFKCVMALYQQFLVP